MKTIMKYILGATSGLGAAMYEPDRLKSFGLTVILCSIIVAILEVRK